MINPEKKIPTNGAYSKSQNVTEYDTATTATIPIITQSNFPTVTGWNMNLPNGPAPPIVPAPPEVNTPKSKSMIADNPNNIPKTVTLQNSCEPQAFTFPKRTTPTTKTVRPR